MRRSMRTPHLLHSLSLCPSPARSSRLLRICSDPSPPDTCWSASSATRTSAPWAAATLAQPTCCAPAARVSAPPPFYSTCSRAAPPSGWARGLAAHVLLCRPRPRDIEALAALCAVLGHMFPVWLRFRGGKGVATGFGVFLVASPLAALSAIAVFARDSGAHPLCLAGLRPRLRQLSRLCLAAG